MEPIEWEVVRDNELRFQRDLPNGIRFGSEVSSEDNVVRMEMWLHNGTEQALTGMRSQVCVMLKGLIGFNSKRRRESVVRGPLIAIKADHHNRWVITGWEPNHRAWANPPVPCIHSDPIFPIATRAKRFVFVVRCGFTKETISRTRFYSVNCESASR